MLKRPGDLSFVSGGGEMGRLIRERDWKASAFGPLERWPQSLRSALSICLHSSFPTAIYWGEDLRLLYNDAWSPIPGERHPAALGEPGSHVWQDIWDVVGPQFARVMSTGEGFSTFDEMLPMVRQGKVCETYWNYSLTPIVGEDGSVAGVLNQGHETTDRILFERRKVEETESLRQMFDQAPGFMALLAGPDHVFELANAAYVRLIGNRNVIGKPVKQALPEIEGQGFIDLLDQVYSTGESFVGRGVTADLDLAGDGADVRHFLDFVYQPLTDTNGKVWGIFVQGSDVTDRHSAEVALKESEARFEAITNSIDQMIWSTRPDGHHDYYNDRWYEFTGVPHGSTDGEAWNGMFHPDDQERAWVTWRHSLATAEPYHIEYRLRHRSGEYRWVLGRAQCVRDAEGKITRWFGTCTDIQDIVEAREVLAQSREQLTDLVEQRTLERNRVWEMSSDLFAIMDFDGHLRAINPAWSATLGFDEATLLARDARVQVHPDDQARLAVAVGKLRNGEAIPHFENRLQHADGSWRWIDWALVPEGDVFYAVGRDMTAARQTAVELETAQEALRQSQKMEAMGQLTGGVAHDFNNLLSPIIGGLDLLQRRQVGDERTQRTISGALASAERAKTLVHRLLAFARRQPLQPVSVNLAHLIEGMADLIDSTTGPQVRVFVKLAQHLPPAIADPNQLEMALLNLAVNARDAMPEGGTITISAEPAKLGRRSRVELPP
ncbi:MAG TPA: PAS domain-containing protein, partial [Sphingomicrobium sp.]